MKQHYLPQAYLREFCNSDQKLYTLDLDLLKHGRDVFSETKTTAEVCRSVDFYKIEGDFKNQFQHMDGLDPMFLEKKFQEYEREYPKIIAKIKARQTSISNQEAELFMYTLIDLKIRNPYFRQSAIEQKKETVMDDLFDTYRAELTKLELTNPKQIQRKEVFLAEMDKMKDKVMTDKKFAQKAHLSSLVLRHMEEENMQTKIAQHLIQFEWRIFYSHNDFFTTDNPGVSIDSTDRPQNTKFDKDFFFFMPITPHMCFAVSPKTVDFHYRKDATVKQLHYLDAPKKLVHKINELHGYHITKYLFANNERLINIIAKKINEWAAKKRRAAKH
jgi:hypothetical protein